MDLKKQKNKYQSIGKLEGIVGSLGIDARGLVQIAVVIDGTDSKILTDIFIGPGNQLIEDMEIAFVLCDRNNAGFFEQEVGNLAADRPSSVVKHDFHVFSESAAVPITNSCGISKRFQQRIALQNDFLDILKRLLLSRSIQTNNLDPLSSTRYIGDIVHY